MSVYDTIREGLAEDFRKAQDYDRLVKSHALQLAVACENPNQEIWRAGFDAGWEACRRRYKGERPKDENEFWEEFKATRTKTDVEVE